MRTGAQYTGTLDTSSILVQHQVNMSEPLKPHDVLEFTVSASSQIVAPHGFLEMWTIYEKPEDYPDHWVIRRTRIADSAIFHDNEAMIASSLQEAQKLIPFGKFRLNRQDDDAPSIVEVWI